ncbi:WxL domain-containing protein [Vagococcus lutrae]|uniref:WxL domain-containing protein n=1 Tax=Vagococcus lutrae TaxID=81947 RepID=UPI001C97FE88|nr:WxL domain-containing protein [Vagococcus lutrae]QZN89323.1 WxL domain-containing protein [Vagococcus lutrae]
MKKHMILSTVLVSSLFLGATVAVNAAEGNERYPEAGKANTTSKVNFIKTDKPEIVDPDNPDKPIIPVDPDNPDEPVTNPNNEAELVLQYVPNFEFGTYFWTPEGLTVPAKSDFIKGDEKPEEVVPFISTMDMRAVREGGWKLEVSSGDFTHNESGHVLEGAEVVFTNANYGSAVKAPVITGTAMQSDIDKGFKLGGVKQKLATADGESSQGIGSYSLKLGTQLDSREDDANEKYMATNGVHLVVPPKTPASVGEYTAELEWSLTPGI